MKVFKFGGASVKDATGVKNLSSIVHQQQGQLIVVVSAMGKRQTCWKHYATPTSTKTLKRPLS